MAILVTTLTYSIPHMYVHEQVLEKTGFKDELQPCKYRGGQQALEAATSESVGAGEPSPDAIYTG